MSRFIINCFLPKWFRDNCMSLCYLSLIWKEVWKKKHSTCLSRALLWGNSNASAPQIVKADKSPVCWADSGLLTCLARHLLSLSSASFSAALRSIWLIERTVPVCHLAISTVVHKLSVKRLFNNIASHQPKDTVDHYRAITSEILVWTSGGKLMCYCDERFSLRALQQEPEQERPDQLQISSCECVAATTKSN